MLQSLDDCVSDFIMQRLDCHLPWITKKSSKRTCNRPEDLDGFINAIMDLRQGALTSELRSYGCLKPNCITEEWYVTMRDIYSEMTDNQTGRYNLESTPSNCLKVTRQILIYGFSNFVADFGGYLGLLLGASLLSLFDDATDLIKMFLQRFAK